MAKDNERLYISQQILGNFNFRTTLKIAPCVDVGVFLSVAWVGKPAVAVVKLALERLLTWNIEVSIQVDIEESKLDFSF